MKSLKFLSLLVIVVLLVSPMAGCKKATPTPAPAEATPTPKAEATPTPKPAEKDLLDIVLEKGTLVVSTDPNYAPQSFLNEKGELDGFDVNVAQEVAKRLGVKLEFVTPDWDMITAGNWGGRWDLSIGSMTITEDRMKVLWFTIPYYYTPASFAVHKDNVTIRKPADFAGKTVGVGAATTYEAYLGGTLKIVGEEPMYPPPEGVIVKPYSTDAEAIQDLALGDGVRLDGVMSALPTLENAIKEGVPIKIVGTPAFYEPLAFALDKARGPSDKMIKKLNEIIQAMHDDGTLSDLSMKWYGVDITKKVKPEEAEKPAGGTFIFGRGGDSVQLDPAIVTDGESFRVTGQCLEPLYQYEPGSTRPIPALATECVPNEDSTEWTCKLRQGVKFHDGTPFNADAVIFNFERWRNTDHPYHFESQVFEYYEYMWYGFDDDSIIKSIEKIDDYTVKFVLKDPLAPFLANLAMDMFAISSPEAIKKYGEKYGMPDVGCVGTGPFKFVEWVEGDHITVERNPDWWGGVVHPDKVIWRVIPDNSARFLALKAGDIHAMEQANIEDIKAAQADPNLYVLARPALNTAYLAFNYKIKEFQDPRVREAVFHAINRQAIVETFYGEYGEVATNFLPPAIWGHNDEIEDWTYDPELSKKLLAEAGFPDGLSEVTLEDGTKIPLRLYYMPVVRFYYPDPKEIAEAMAADLAKAGIKVELVLAGDWPTYLGLRREGKLYGLYQLGWGGDNGDPDNFHNYFFGGLSSADEEKKPDPREGWYANTEVARLLFKAARIPNQAEREKIYKKVEELLHEDRARLWVAHNNTPLLFSKKVSGYIPQPVGADYYEWTIVAP